MPGKDVSAEEEILHQDEMKHEKAEMLIGSEATTKRAWEFFSTNSKKFYVCTSSAATPVAMTIFGDAYKDMKSRGTKIKWVTDITKDNLAHCKDLMQYAEVRHISHFNGNFALNETEYITAPIMKEGQPLLKLIYSNSKEMVEQQQYIFDIFWSKAVPAEQRIREIEEEREQGFFEVINNPERAAEVYTNLARSIKSSALLLLPSSKALVREYKLGVLEHIAEASKNKNIRDIRIICSIDDNNAHIIRWLHEKTSNVKILNTATNLAIKVFIVNDAEVFRAELRDPDADTFLKALGFATYSNSKPTVDAFKSFFELLWDSHTTNEKLQGANRKLQQADKLQREFINIAAHELRTPIVPILNLSELLYSKLKEDQQQRVQQLLLQQQGKAPEEEQQLQQNETLEMLEIILRNANRLHQLTEDILDVTRIETHTLTLRKERLNLNDVILNVVENYRRQIASSSSSNTNNGNVKLMYKPANSSGGSAGSSILVEADKRRLTQVISNLLNNAIKFTQEGTVTVSTTARIKRGKDVDRDEREGQEVLIAVRDTGTGIDPELMPRLFTKFAAKSYQGTGLGLFISKSIIEAHGGKMWAENNTSSDDDHDSDSKTKCNGATFYFTLPVMNMNLTEGEK
jgi:two-component system, OmpR family, sensor histidine kinase VicK